MCGRVRTIEHVNRDATDELCYAYLDLLARAVRNEFYRREPAHLSRVELAGASARMAVVGAKLIASGHRQAAIYLFGLGPHRFASAVRTMPRTPTH